MDCTPFAVALGSNLYRLGVHENRWGSRPCDVRRTQVMSYNRDAMIAKDLLEILVCPACKRELEYRQDPETLKCTGCHRVYPVKDDIPIMLVDEATIEA